MGPRILIVDDNSLVRKSLRGFIESHTAWQVCAEAENGQQAVELARDLHPDLIVLDLSMPVMNGLQAARAISRMDPSIKLMMLTLHHSHQLEDDARKAGISTVISKTAGFGKHLLSLMESILPSMPPDAGHGNRGHDMGT